MADGVAGRQLRLRRESTTVTRKLCEQGLPEDPWLCRPLYSTVEIWEHHQRQGALDRRWWEHLRGYFGTFFSEDWEESPLDIFFTRPSPKSMI